MRKLSTEKRAMILHALVEGNSINATSRLCGCSKITVLRLLADAGTFCAQFHDEQIRNLQCERIVYGYSLFIAIRRGHNTPSAAGCSHSSLGRSLPGSAAVGVCGSPLAAPHPSPWMGTRRRPR